MELGSIFSMQKYAEGYIFAQENNYTIKEIEGKNEYVEKEEEIINKNGEVEIKKEKRLEFVRYFQIVEKYKPSLEELKGNKKEEINAERDSARKIEGAEYDGDIFDIDEVSQNNILAQIKVAEIIGDQKATYNYRSKTNTDHLLTLAQLQELGLAIAVKVNAIYVKSWDLKAQVDKATTAEEVEAIKWTSA